MLSSLRLECSRQIDRMASTSTYKKATISFTLPISCQICLGKVKQPVICPNQHVFCTPCLDVWLRHNQLCPTCRVPITPESPCKQIRGGPTPPDEKPEKGLGRALRRARVDVIFDEYENEMERLEEEIELLQSEKRKFGARAPSGVNKEDVQRSVEAVRSEVNREEIIQRLTVKLDATAAALERETMKFKETNSKLRDENVALSIENGRLKQSLAARSPRKYEKYAQAALQQKVDNCTKEILQLKRALSRSDDYTEELEDKLRLYQEKYGDVSLLEKDECKTNGDGDMPSWTSDAPPSFSRRASDDGRGVDNLRPGRVVTGVEIESKADQENLEDTPPYPLRGCKKIFSGKNGDEGRLQNSYGIDGKGGGDRPELRRHSPRLVNDIAGASEESLRDGASPAKRRLVIADDGDDDWDNGRSLQKQQPCVGKRAKDDNLSREPSSLADLSGLTGNSSTLEAPSPPATATPPTSMRRLQLHDRQKRQEAVPLEKGANRQGSFTGNKNSRQLSNAEKIPSHHHRRSTSPRRVLRSLIFSDEEEEDSPDNGVEEGNGKGSQCIGMGDKQMESLGRSQGVDIGHSQGDFSATGRGGREQMGHEGAVKRDQVRFTSNGPTSGFRGSRADGVKESYEGAKRATGSSQDSTSDETRSDWDRDASLSNPVKGTRGSDPGERGAFNCYDRGAAGHSSNKTLDDTLSNLDFSLTPEFVHCTKLFREAEDRLSSRHSAEK